MDWLTANMPTILVSVILGLILTGILVHLIRKHKKGESFGCGCGCEQCPMHGECHASSDKE